MARQVLLLFAFLVLNVSLVLCREDNHQHISDSFSHHHSRSTPEDSVLSTKDPLSVTAGEGKPSGDIQHGYGDDNYIIYNRDIDFDSAYNTVLTIQIVSIVISLASLVIGLLIIFLCGKKIGRKVRQGFIVNRNEGNTVGLQPPGYAASQQLTRNPAEVELQKVPLPMS